jgi:hypothetical protein
VAGWATSRTLDENGIEQEDLPAMRDCLVEAEAFLGESTASWASERIVPDNRSVSQEGDSRYNFIEGLL